MEQTATAPSTPAAVPADVVEVATPTTPTAPTTLKKRKRNRKSHAELAQAIAEGIDLDVKVKKQRKRVEELYDYDRFTWVGVPTSVQHYNMMEVRLPDESVIKVTVGSFIIVMGRGNKSYIGLVDQMTQNPTGKRNIQLKKVVRNTDIPAEKRLFATTLSSKSSIEEDRDVYITSVMVNVELDKIIGKCEVVCLGNCNPIPEDTNDDALICRYSYDFENGSLKPLSDKYCDVIMGTGVMELAKQVVERYRARGEKLPRMPSSRKTGVVSSPDTREQAKDCQRLVRWRNQDQNPELRSYLNAFLPGWDAAKAPTEDSRMANAQGIVARYHARGDKLPKCSQKDNLTEEKIIEKKDSQYLYEWRRTLNGTGDYTLSPEVKAYLDAEMPEWSALKNAVAGSKTKPKPVPRNPNYKLDLEAARWEKARGIVARYHERGGYLPQWKADDKVQHKDVQGLHEWRRTRQGNGDYKLPEDIAEYLDYEMPGWSEPRKASTTTAPARAAPAPGLVPSASLAPRPPRGYGTGGLEGGVSTEEHFRALSREGLINLELMR